MDDFIKDLIELDHKAKDRIRKAEESRDAAKAQISRDKEKVYQEQLAKVQARIDQEKQKAQADAESQLSDIEGRFQAAMKELDSQYAENRERWVADIVKACKQTALSQ